MNQKQFMKWLSQQGKFNTLEELYLMTLHSNLGLQAVKDWIDSREEFSCSRCSWRGSVPGTLLMKVISYKVGESLDSGVQLPDEEIACCPLCQNINLEKIK